MKVEMRRESYRVSYGALEWLVVAECLEDWGLCDGAWPYEQDSSREAVASWARAVYDAAISDRQKFTLPMPRSWTLWLWRVLSEATSRDDQFPWTMAPSLTGQIKAQNRRR
ncbi:hypothetical protein [Streptomyces sp. NPDC057854]|uniref:hypothetical protein n=1 Tax=unclassified Streptomyces TaxID=2593676 RepID=UPI00367EC46A